MQACRCSCDGLRTSHPVLDTHPTSARGRTLQAVAMQHGVALRRPITSCTIIVLLQTYNHSFTVFGTACPPSRAQVILQQAALAGSTAAASSSPAACPQADQLLDQARQLAAAYGVDPLELALHHLGAMISGAPAVTPEVRRCAGGNTSCQHQLRNARRLHLAASFSSVPVRRFRLSFPQPLHFCVLLALPPSLAVNA